MSSLEYTNTSNADTEILSFLVFSADRRVSLQANTWKSQNKKLTISKTVVDLI